MFVVLCGWGWEESDDAGSSRDATGKRDSGTVERAYR